MNNIIEIKNVEKKYKITKTNSLFKKEYFYALNDVSVDINENKTYSIVGESGSGKSTIAMICSKFTTYDCGSITFKGQELSEINNKELIEFRKKVQIIFQNSIGSLNPLKTVKWNLEQIVKENTNLNKEEMDKKIIDGLHSVGLSKSYLEYFPSKLSGGQAQRVAILSAMLLEPEVLICDEITSALDVSVQAQILNLLLKMKLEKKLTIIFITHDLEVARYIADNVIIMEKGRVVEQGLSEEVFNNPQKIYSKKLLKANIKLNIGGM